MNEVTEMEHEDELPGYEIAKREWRKNFIYGRNIYKYTKDWAIVRVWSPSGKRDETFENLSFNNIKAMLFNEGVGHASLQTKNYYISLWPSERPSFITTLNGADSGEYFNNIRQDFFDEGRECDFAVVLNTLDVGTIEKNIKSIDVGYNLIGKNKTERSLQNCSGLVVQLLSSGSYHMEHFDDNVDCDQDLTKGCYFPKIKKIEYVVNKTYTPCDVARLATEIKMSEIEFFKHLGLDNNEIEALDFIESSYFIEQEIRSSQEIICNLKKLVIVNLEDPFVTNSDEAYVNNDVSKKEKKIDSVSRQFSNNRYLIFNEQNSENIAKLQEENRLLKKRLEILESREKTLIEEEKKDKGCCIL